MEFEMEMREYSIEDYYRNEELWALVEMKILYLYKFFEISIKKLLRSSFKSSSTKDFYKWDTLIRFLKSKNINPREIVGYNEIFLLKDVNNSLKHSGGLDEKLISKMIEFKEGKNYGYKQLDSFYERIKSFPKLFLENLVSEIYNELYKFDNKKIEKIAKDITFRMEKEDAFRLIEKLKSRYI